MRQIPDEVEDRWGTLQRKDHYEVNQLQLQLRQMYYKISLTTRTKHLYLNSIVPVDNSLMRP